MTRLKAWTVLLTLCAISPLTHAQEIKGKEFFSVEILESAWRKSDGSKGPKKRTGIFYYYYKEGGPDEYGPTITGYKLRAGKIIDVAGAGGNHTGVPRITTADGARFRIRYDLNGVSIDHTAWNPGPIIHFHAPCSENPRKLDELTGLLAAYYGRRQFQL